MIDRMIMLFMSMMLVSCATGSALKRYDGHSYPATDKCEVKVFHSNYWLEKYIKEEMGDGYVMIGSSNFNIHDNNTTYDKMNMQNDCKRVGADLVIIVDKGVVASEVHNWSYEYTSPARSNINYYDGRGHMSTSTITYNENKVNSGSTRHTWTGYEAFFFKDRNMVETYDKYKDYIDDEYDKKIEECCRANYGPGEWVIKNCIENAKKNTHHSCAYEKIGNMF